MLTPPEAAIRSDRMAGGFGDVLASAGQRPPDLAAGQLLDLPARVLLHTVIAPALGVPITQAGPAPGLIRDVMFEITVRRGTPAAGAGACRVPDLSQVAELDTGIMTLGLVPVIAVSSGDRLDVHEQVPLAGDPGGQPPRPVPSSRAGRADGSEGEPGPAGRIGTARFVRFSADLAAGGGRGPGTAVPDGVALAVGDREAPGGAGV